MAECSAEQLVLQTGWCTTGHRADVVGDTMHADRGLDGDGELSDERASDRHCRRKWNSVRQPIRRLVRLTQAWY